ncbi:acyl carrier protein [Streptomyces sp. DSM 40750]|uniref:acyl carrier protein n=1 Tax=Streptomyces sp. DSM 40750 TaxID=2801030 RepID=UPI00214BA01B|nr:acyl carrier protein [Streptomyces sp. DSM 40750]UUU19330.1 acyl carrier protein [Streptomyces sp. DSM 40750]UUU27327.1 acyl carrier protein [Streptomyces sp. DSM 40750]
MRKRSPAARLTTTAVLTLAITGAGVLPAHAYDRAPGVSGDAAYRLDISADRLTTDYDERTVDLTGVLTRPDGTPVADAPVEVGQSVLYNTWNPWGDPIDPTERESRSLGTVRTDDQGRFTLSGVSADRWEERASLFLSPRHEVEFHASYDPAEDPTDRDIVFARAGVAVKPVASGITYKVNKARVRAGDTLVVTGKVTWPAGHGPVAGTRVFLRTYFESQYNAQTTTDAKGNFTVRAKIRGYDREFVILSAPADYYIAKASKALPVRNVTP